MQIGTNDFQTAIEHGKEAWARIAKDSTWEDWLLVGQALEIGREQSMDAAYTREATGRLFNEAMAKFLTDNGFSNIDKGDRSRLRDVMIHLAEITAWRQTLPLTNRLKMNHPSTVIRKWRASLPSTKNKDSSERPNPREEIVRLQNEIARMKRNGGNEVSAQDTAEDIAQWLHKALPDFKLKRTIDRCLELAELTSEEIKRMKGAARERALRRFES